jgi:hypothetical protein
VDDDNSREFFPHSLQCCYFLIQGLRRIAHIHKIHRKLCIRKRLPEIISAAADLLKPFAEPEHILRRRVRQMLEKSHPIV